MEKVPTCVKTNKKSEKHSYCKKSLLFHYVVYSMLCLLSALSKNILIFLIDNFASHEERSRIS
jgi:hypothetical protein